MTHQLSQPEIGRIDPNRTARSNAGTSLMTNAEYMANKDIASLKQTLLENDYTAAQVKYMTVTDMQYAVSLIGLADPP